MLTFLIGLNRPEIFLNTLTSCRAQVSDDELVIVLDRCADNSEAYQKVCAITETYSGHKVKLDRAHGCNHTLTRVLLMGCQQGEPFFIIEDDCFPRRDAFSIMSKKILDNPELASVYGNPFMPNVDSRFHHRMQVWGWVLRPEKFRPLLPELKYLMDLNDAAYFKHMQKYHKQEIADMVQITGVRNCYSLTKTLKSWDCTLVLLAADAGLLHGYAGERVIFNCGAIGTHFKKARTEPPYNMIEPQDVWNYF